MPAFSNSSKAKLNTCHKDLQKLFNAVISQGYDCTIICGHRCEAEQNEAFRTGASKLKFPRSKHNSNPSLAVDVAPYPIDWNDKFRFYHFAGYAKGLAESMEIKIRWGGDWNGNYDFKDQNFHDLPHFELCES